VIAHNKRNPAARRAREHQRGLMLIEVAVMLLIEALIFLTGISIYKVYTKTNHREILNQRLDTVNKAILRHFSAPGVSTALPCPADPSLPRTDPNYGVANCNTPPPASMALTTLASVRGSLPITSPNYLNPPPRVRIGAVPVRTLGLPDVAMATPDGFLFIYAVTESMTVPACPTCSPPRPAPDQELGGIDVRSPSSGISLIRTTPFGAGSALYIVALPPGPGGGAWTLQGGYSGVCSPATSGTLFENCNGDTVFVSGP
jgi:hypothetical protein